MEKTVSSFGTSIAGLVGGVVLLMGLIALFQREWRTACVLIFSAWR
jgi:hypothetical protein